MLLLFYSPAGDLMMQAADLNPKRPVHRQHDVTREMERPARQYDPIEVLVAGLLEDAIRALDLEWLTSTAAAYLFLYLGLDHAIVLEALAKRKDTNQ